MKNRTFAGLTLPGVAALALILPAAWATHLVWVIISFASEAGVTAGQIVLGFVGAFMPPVGVVHGLMIWFGLGM